MGGAAETVVHGETGILYQEAGAEGLINAIRHFEERESRFDPSDAVRRAGIFSVDQHEAAMGQLFAAL